MFGETDSSQGSQNGDAIPAEGLDLMLSGLNSSSNGQAVGLPEAFIPTQAPRRPSQDQMNAIASNFLDFPDDESGEMDMNLDDMISFGNDSDDESPTSPIFMPDDLDLLNSGSALSHLNNMNVTAFRRNADPTFATQSLPPTPIRGHFARPRVNRKRRSENDSPYNHSHYQGVTPVQRITDNNPLHGSPTPVNSHKRRKTIHAL